MMKIEYVSDVVCPWCAIGLHSLEIALQRAGLPADIELQPFELNPQMPPEGEDLVEHLGRKYGVTAEQTQHTHQAIRERGAAVGFTFDTVKRTRIVNTFDAHRLLHWAGLEGRALPLKHALLAAYFTHGENVADHAVLARVAGEAGFDRSRAQEVLASGAHAAEVRERERFWQELGIHSVPSVVIDGRHLIQGGQPPEVFEQALRRLAAGTGTP